MQFCPMDGSLLQVQVRSNQPVKFFCPVCPYKNEPRKAMSTLVPTKKKRADDIRGGAAAWENVDRTQARCPVCDHPEAYFKQIQIRSADEPMTTFYRCVNCAHRWNE